MQDTGHLGKEELSIFDKLADIARQEKAIFTRIEPPQGWNAGQTEALEKQWQIKPSPSRYTPEHTLILDLKKSEEELLAEMKPKGRYNIGVAKKHGIAVRQYASGEHRKLDDFYEILRHTGTRDGFGIHPQYFYERLLETFTPHHMASLFVATTKDETPIAGIIVVYYKDTATYYFGASDHRHRALMAPYLLQWEALREAKKRGMKQYDFLGIAPADTSANEDSCISKNNPRAVTPPHPWAGVTEFKKKFGGREVSYPAAFDVVYKPFWYQMYRLAK